jgi:hypothetical protein
MKKTQKKSAGKAERGNVTVDLGEKHTQKIERMIESKLTAAGMAGSRPASAGIAGRSSGSNRPWLGNSAGYKPWYSRFGKPWLGQDATVTAFTTPRARFNIIPVEIKTVDTAKAVTGVALGLLGNRALVRVTPMLWPTQANPLVHQGIAALAGLVPLLFERNSMTVGVAIPGMVYFFGTLVDQLYTAVGMPQRVVMAGGEGAPRATDPNQSARARLAAIQQRINAPQMGSQRSLPRVVAQPQFA